MFVCCKCCVLPVRGLCDGLITRPEGSYRLWRVVVCDQETSKTRRLKPATGLWKIQPQWVVTPGKQTNKQWSVNSVEFSGTCGQNLLPRTLLLDSLGNVCDCVHSFDMKSLSTVGSVDAKLSRLLMGRWKPQRTSDLHIARKKSVQRAFRR